MVLTGNNYKEEQYSKAKEENLLGGSPSSSLKPSSSYWRRGYVWRWNKSALHSLTQVLSTKVARDVGVQVNLNATTTAQRIRDFKRMNPLTLFGSKVKEDPQGFID